jgi:PAS domain S-box-containing protein
LTDGPVIARLRTRRSRADASSAELALSERRYRSLVEATSQIVWWADAEGREGRNSPQWRAFTGQSSEAAIGMGWLDALHPDDRDRVSRLWADAIKSGDFYEAEYRLRRADGEYRTMMGRATTLRDDDGTVVEWIGALVDVTESREAQAELRDRARQQEAVADLGRLALTGGSVEELVERAVTSVIDALGVKCVEVLELLTDSDELAVQAGAGWNEGVVGVIRLTADATTLQGFTLDSGEPVTVGDLASENRFVAPAYLLDHGVGSSVAVIIRGGNGPYGVLAAHARGRRRFGSDDAIFLRGVANVLGAAIQRQRAEAETRATRDELQALIEASPVPIVAYDRAGVVTLWNPAAEQVFGWTEEEAVGQLLPIVQEEMLDEFHTIRQRVLEGHPFSGFETTGQRKSGESVDVSFWNAAVRDPRGAVRGVVAVVSDISERKRREDALAFLAESGAILSSTLDYERTLAEVARLAVPRLADCCVVDVLDEDEHAVHRLAVVHVDPLKEKLVEELERLYPADPSSPASFVGRILREGHPRLEEEMPDELLETIARDGEHLAALRRLGLVSGMFVPLPARGRILGAITLLSAESGRHYDRDDLSLATDLARHAALAVDNARLYRQRSHIASTLQQSLLPPGLPEVPGAELAVRYRAAGEGLEVGGDFYDAFQTREHEWAVVIGDVCGKGPEAAAVTGLTRHTIRASALRDRSPSRTLETLNAAILREYGGTTFCTVAYGLLDLSGTRPRLTFACGGHPLPLRLPPGGGVGTLGCHGTLIGIFADPELSDETVELEDGEVLVLYTDGLVEGDGGQLEEGESRLMALLERCHGLTAEQIAARIEAMAVAAGAQAARDDVAILVLRIATGSVSAGQVDLEPDAGRVAVFDTPAASHSLDEVEPEA